MFASIDVSGWAAQRSSAVGAARLSVFDPGISEDQDGGEVSLRDAYERFVLRDLTDAKRPVATAREYATAVRYAEEFQADPGGSYHRCTRPMVATIDRQWLRDFRSWLLRPERAVSTRTANKHLGNVCAVLAACQREEILDRVPRIRCLPAQRANRKVAFTAEEIDALYQAAKHVRWPDCSEITRIRWRALIVLFSVYGTRCQDLVSHEACKPGLCWDAWHGSACPEDETISCADGWLVISQAKTHRDVTVPLTRQAAAHLECLRRSKPGPGKVFPFPLSAKSFYGAWHAIRNLAADSSRSERLRTADVHNFRDTATTWHNRVTPKIATYFTGHAEAGVSDVHYNLPYGGMVDHLARCRWPASFDEDLPTHAGGPLLLYPPLQ